VTSEGVYVVLFVAVVLVILFVALLLLAIQRLRRRKTQLLDDLKSSPRLNSDRAFNRLEMARREAAVLSRQGVEISRARELIAQSQAALDLRQFERAYERAQSAHEALVAARQGRPLAAATPTREPMSPRSGSMGPDGSSATALPSTPAPTGLPKNRAESQFEMRLLDSDVESAKQSKPSDPATLAATDFQGKAQAAFDSGEYTEALRLALKGRRGLGGKVETVAPGPSSRPLGGASSPNDPQDPGATAERAASATRCSSCGYPTTPDDVFCRGCGSPRAPAACPRCGTPRTPADTFCGRCGERFS
jgi:Double zinc ribbon